MTHRFKWRGAAVLQLIAEAEQAPSRWPQFDDLEATASLASSPRPAATCPARISFVIDDGGVYLVSNAQVGPGARRRVEYAEGFDSSDGTPGGPDVRESFPAEDLKDIQPNEWLVIEFDRYQDDHFAVSIWS